MGMFFQGVSAIGDNFKPTMLFVKIKDDQGVAKVSETADIKEGLLKESGIKSLA